MTHPLIFKLEEVLEGCDGDNERVVLLLTCAVMIMHRNGATLGQMRDEFEMNMKADEEGAKKAYEKWAKKGMS